MSADNWRLCPKCQAGPAEKDGVRENAFREDYELFTDDDTLHVHYSGFCTQCGFAWRHEVHQKMI